MFSDQSNHRLVRKLFIRSNPDGKRNVVQSIRLNSSFWQDAQISIFLDKQPVETVTKLKQLASSLTHTPRSQHTLLELARKGLQSELEAPLLVLAQRRGKEVT